MKLPAISLLLPYVLWGVSSIGASLTSKSYHLNLLLSSRQDLLAY
jgi:tryptophan-rich sensory protein